MASSTNWPAARTNWSETATALCAKIIRGRRARDRERKACLPAKLQTQALNKVSSVPNGDE
jgi:hypothetical protein